MPNELKLSSLQMSGKDLPVLKIILTLTKADPLATWDYTDDTHNAAALLIDTDTAEGRELVADLAGSGRGQVLIACTSRENGLADDVLVLQKPLRSKNILLVLRQAAEQYVRSRQGMAGMPTPSTSAAAAPAAPRTPPGVQRERRVLDLLPSDPEKALRVVEKATQHLIVFDRWRNRYYVYDREYAAISNLLLRPANAVIAEEIDRRELTKEISRLIPHELDLLVWKAALAASQGQLCEGLSRTEFFQLRRWPDLKRLGANPLHMRLTALLRKGGTIDYLADFLNAPAAEVIDFINACYALTYLEHQNKPVAPAAPAKKPLSESKRGLFSRIRSRLGI